MVPVETWVRAIKSLYLGLEGLWELGSKAGAHVACMGDCEKPSSQDVTAIGPVQAMLSCVPQEPELWKIESTSGCGGGQILK